VSPLQILAKAGNSPKLTAGLKNIIVPGHRKTVVMAMLHVNNGENQMTVFKASTIVKVSTMVKASTIVKAPSVVKAFDHDQGFNND
jgi:hypothetical protein